MDDDTLRDTPDVVEAVRRLPKEVAEARQYRITRALYLSMRKEILPKEEWTSYDMVQFLKKIPDWLIELLFLIIMFSVSV